MATQEKYPNRWIQLVLGIVCMATIANCQYGWTLFVAPIEDKYHWARTAIQLSFTIFLFFETWLVPLEGWGVDKFGPRPVIIFGAILSTIGWILCSKASSPSLLGSTISAIVTIIKNRLKTMATWFSITDSITSPGNSFRCISVVDR